MADNDQDFYKEFKERMNVDPLKDISVNGENKPSTSGSHTLTIVTAVITGILVSTLIGWYFIGNLIVSKTGNIDNANNIPTINRAAAPIKIKPQDEGGMKIANQEKKVYDLIGQNNSKDITRERVVNNKISAVAPSDEEFLGDDPEYQDDEPAKKDDKIANLIRKVDDKVIEPVKIAEAKKTQITPATPVSVAASSLSAPIRILPKEEAKNIVKNEPKKIEPTTASNKKEVIKDAFAVQVLSTREEAQTKTALTNLIKKMPEVSKMIAEVEKADLGTKGIYYRLKIGSFKNRQEANNLCQKFKAKGQDCITTLK